MCFSLILILECDTALLICPKLQLASSIQGMQNWTQGGKLQILYAI